MNRQVQRYTFTLKRAGGLLLAGPFSRDGRRELGRLATTLGWGRHAHALADVAIADVVSPGGAIELVGLDANDWNTTTTELAVIAGLCRQRSPRRLFEFGTYDGRTTATLLVNAPADAHAWTLDLPAELPRTGDVQPPVGARLRDDSRLAGRYTQIFADSLAWQPPAELIGTIDLCFVDAGHSYACCEADTRNALAMRSPGAAIVWHDYAGEFEGVTRAVDAVARQTPALRFVHVRGTSLAVAMPA